MPRFKLKQTWPFHLMLLPGVALVVLFSYIPMVGIVIAFQNYLPTKGFFGSQWIGLQNFQFMLALPDTLTIVRNTLVIAVLKIIVGLIVPLVFSLLLNEVRVRYLKRTIQTVVFFPYFLSWVILGGILIDILSIHGAVNRIINAVGFHAVFFLGDPKWFVVVAVISDVWKEMGLSIVIYLAALTNIDPGLYEAAMIDGANRWKQILHVTIPGIMPIMILLATLSLGNILNAGFDQIFNLYNPLVYQTADIIDTYVYRIGLINAQYGLATAIGLFKSVVGFVLIIVSYMLAKRYANYRIF